MPGIAGSLLQMIEGAGVGATLDLDAIPTTGQHPARRWLLTFPSFGFLLAGDERTRREVFHDRGLACAPCGTFDATRQLNSAPAARPPSPGTSTPRRSRA